MSSHDQPVESAHSRGIGAWVSGRLSPDAQMAVRLLAKMLWRHRWLSCLSIAANTAAAFFEAGTLGILMAAAQLMVERGATEAGAVTAWVETTANALGLAMTREYMFLALIGLAVAAQILRSALTLGGIISTAYLQTRVQEVIQNRVFGQIMSMSYPQVSHYHAGDLWQYVKLGAAINKLVASLNSLVLYVLITLVYVGALFWISWPLAAAVTLGFALLSGSLGRLMRLIQQNAQRLLAVGVAFSKSVFEFLAAHRVVRTFGQEEYARGVVAEHLHASMIGARKGTILNAVIAPILETVTVIGLAVVLMGGYLLYSRYGQQILPSIIMFLIIVYRLLPRIGALNHLRAEILRSQPSLLRVSGFLRPEDKEFTTHGGRPFGGVREAIEYRGLTKRYVKGERPAVYDISFTIPRNKFVALVGESGAGKSTVADLLVRLYEPTDGQILVDGVPLYEYDLQQWREHLGVVSQETFLFHTSIRDNISFGQPGADEAAIVSAAKAAHAHDFILELEKGYDTIIGDRGYRLSGGQQQRIAIARAFLRDPEVLLLDEATSNLDSESERLIQQGLDHLRKGRTVLAIAHRLSTIRNADEILVLSRGRLVERGTHKALLRHGGIYARVWRIQSGTEEGAERPAPVEAAR